MTGMRRTGRESGVGRKNIRFSHPLRPGGSLGLLSAKPRGRRPWVRIAIVKRAHLSSSTKDRRNPISRGPAKQAGLIPRFISKMAISRCVRRTGSPRGGTARRQAHLVASTAPLDAQLLLSTCFTPPLHAYRTRRVPVALLPGDTRALAMLVKRGCTLHHVLTQPSACQPGPIGFFVKSDFERRAGPETDFVGHP